MNITKLIGDDSLLGSLQGIQSELSRQNGILEMQAASSRGALLKDFASVAHIVRNGDAASVFDIGDQLITTYTDATGKEHEMPWNVVHIGDAELEDGEIVPGLWLQSHYATVETVAFDNYQALRLLPDGLAPGTYNITFQSAYGPIKAGESLQFTTTKTVPAGGVLAGIRDGSSAETISALKMYTYTSQMETAALETLSVTVGTGGTNLGTVTSEIQELINTAAHAAWGHNDYLTSAQRQWLNSAAAAGGWYTPSDAFKMAPTNLDTINGFMHGLPADFLSAVKPVKVQVAANTVDLGGVTQVMYDKFFLPSTEQLYIQPQAKGVEGEYWEYWRRASGADAPEERTKTYPRRITYSLDTKTAQTVRLRSANRSNAAITWYVNSSGFVNSIYARTAYRCAPACVIC